MQVGEQKKLNRKTFLLNGVFINQGSVVQLMEKTDEGFNVQYADREGFPHIIKGVRLEELEDL